MHPNPVFHDANAKLSLDFARERGFGVLAVNGATTPMLSHVPFLLNATGDLAELHLVRSNPIVRATENPMPAKIAVSGGDSYVSPDWYETTNQVPTWNYVAVHLTGVLERRPEEELHALLDRQSAFYENRLLPKPPWKTAKMTHQELEKMMRMIVPFRFTVTEVDGTWKLSQNKPDAVRLRAAKQMAAYGFGQDVATLSAQMQGIPPKDKK